MNTLIEVVLALLVVGFVALPLLKEQLGEEETLDLPEEVEELYRRKETTYSALKELEFDFKTGKLSEGDFHELDARYRSDALEILASIDAREKGLSDTSGTRKGKAQRTRSRAAAGEPVSAVVAPNEDPFTCAACGRANPEGARFCAGCGGEVGSQTDVIEPEYEEDAAGEGVACEECGTVARPGHRFCATCGAEVQG
ncbi:MAG: zinc ribbon domain-containing protein [Thermoleophilia bacterium]